MRWRLYTVKLKTLRLTVMVRGGGPPGPTQGVKSRVEFRKVQTCALLAPINIKMLLQIGIQWMCCFASRTRRVEEGEMRGGGLCDEPPPHSMSGYSRFPLPSHFPCPSLNDWRGLLMLWAQAWSTRGSCRGQGKGLNGAENARGKGHGMNPVCPGLTLRSGSREWSLKTKTAHRRIEAGLATGSGVHFADADPVTEMRWRPCEDPLCRTSMKFNYRLGAIN